MEAYPDVSYINSHADGIAKMEDEEGATYGIIMEGQSADYVLANHCDFYRVGDLATRYYGLATAKGKYTPNRCLRKSLHHTIDLIN